MPGVLVIAANGFVGRAVMGELRRQGREAFGAMRRDCDVRDADQVEALVARLRPDAVVNCAGVTDGADAGPYYDAHVGGTLNVLGAVRRHVPDSPVVLLGSAAEYGPVEAASLPVREDHPPAPATFYGASKLAQTHLGLVAASAWGLNVKTARPFNLLGPGLPGQYLVAALAARLKCLPAGSPFLVHDRPATRDFVDVRDAAAALVLLTGPEVAPGVYNVAGGQETAVGDVAALLAELAGGPTPGDAEGSSRVKVSRSAGDGTRLRALGWTPRIGWRESVRAFWEDATRMSAPGGSGS